MKTDIICLCCEGQDFRDHICAISSTRGKVLKVLCRGKHWDFCKMCQSLLRKNFESQFRKSRIRIEGD